MKYIIDSSAWIEYFQGSEKGEKVNGILMSDNEILTLALNIAEVISYIERNKGNFEAAYNSMIKNSALFNITPKIAKEAGLLHAQMKRAIKRFGLADAILITSSKALSANLITGDSHFKSFKEAILI